MANPIIIIHGWSDTSKSFEDLRNRLATQFTTETVVLNLGDYISIDDDVTVQDIAFAMNKDVQRFLNQINHKGKIDIVTHSTGSLVTRTWLYEYYKDRIKEIPVERLVMLAPANFGSPLAHKGQTFSSRMIKGFPSSLGNHKKIFQVGIKILKALELGSQYSWDLSINDRFNENFDIYNKENIMCSVIVGNSGYFGLRSAMNEEGSDGTVRVSASNLNCRYVRMDFTKDPHNPIIFPDYNSQGETAYFVADNENHSTITGNGNEWGNEYTFGHIVESLKVTKDTFLEHCDSFRKQTDSLNVRNQYDRFKKPYNNFVTCLKDNFGNEIEDYFIEFYNIENMQESEDRDFVSHIFHNDLIKTVHAYSENSAYRSMLIDSTLIKELQKILLKKGMKFIGISLSAIPIYNEAEGNNVGYLTFTDSDIGGYKLPVELMDKIFKDNSTLLLEIKINREISSEVFKIN
ncbi:MAG: hypothetical protein J0M18_02175 [Ignavibacteria bacterium]|nr:hypothetical protein [Ignavibacteria bacterium]